MLHSNIVKFVCNKSEIVSNGMGANSLSINRSFSNYSAMVLASCLFFCRVGFIICHDRQHYSFSNPGRYWFLCSNEHMLGNTCSHWRWLRQDLNLIKNTPNNRMHSDSKKRRSFLALLFAAGDAKSWAERRIAVVSSHLLRNLHAL